MDRKNNNQHADEQQLARIDELLRQRADSDSEMPWLQLSIENEIAARERARQWLRNNGSLIERNPLAGLTGMVQRTLGGSGWIHAWVLLGAVIFGGLVGFIVARYVPYFSKLEFSITASIPFVSGASSTVIALTALGAAISLTAAGWYYLRDLYTA
jgi:hypothetical protein